MKSTSFLWQYKPTLTNRSFFDMIISYKGPWCRSRRQHGSWKQAAVVFWYCIHPAGRVPGSNGGTRGRYLCGIIHEKFVCSSSSIQSSFVMSRQVLKCSNPRLFRPLSPPLPLFHHCVPLLPRLKIPSLHPPLVPHYLLCSHQCWVGREYI